MPSRSDTMVKRILKVFRILSASNRPKMLKSLQIELKNDPDMAGEMGLSTRTLSRDLETLERFVGCDIQRIKNKGVLLHGTNRLSAMLTFSFEDVVMFCLSQKIFGRGFGGMFANESDSLFNKMNSLFKKDKTPNPSLERLNEFINIVDVPSNFIAQNLSANFIAIARAAALH